MTNNPTDSLDPSGFDRFRLCASPPNTPQARRPPRHRPGEAFLRGPIPFSWIAAACRLPGIGLQVASSFRFLNGRYGGPNRWGLERVALGLGASVRSVRRALNAAELVGLVEVDREPGCKLVVRFRELSESGPTRRPLFGPIPWDWWYVALRLPGPSLRTATACWLTAGWERSGVFDLGLGEWSELDLSRQAAGRGLVELESAGLVVVERRPGVPPIVTLNDAPRRASNQPGSGPSGASGEP